MGTLDGTLAEPDLVVVTKTGTCEPSLLPGAAGTGTLEDPSLREALRSSAVTIVAIPERSSHGEGKGGNAEGIASPIAAALTAPSKRQPSRQAAAAAAAAASPIAGALPRTGVLGDACAG